MTSSIAPLLAYATEALGPEIVAWFLLLSVVAVGGLIIGCVVWVIRKLGR